MAEEKAAEKSDKPLKPGDSVRMTDTQATGEIIEIRDGMVQVESSNFRFRVPVDRIEKISRAEMKKSIVSERSGIAVDYEINQKRIRFSPEIDIRGVRGEEAIMRVQELLDNALMVQHRNLRILHGKGNGILRQLIRNYLETQGFIKSFRDEHVEFGGSGITVIELDL
jgi:DNA mismatch repair protein MutS2